MLKQRFVLLAVTLTILLGAWHLFSLTQLRDQGVFSKYLVFADAILRGDTPHQRLADLSPLYLWITVAQRAIGWEYGGIRLFQVVLTALAALLVGLAAQRLGGGAAGLLAIIVLLLNRGAIVSAAELEPETWILVLTAASLYAAVSRKPFVAGLLAGLGATARPVLLLPIVLLALYWMRTSRRDALRFILAGAIPVMVVLGVNLLLTGEAVIMDPGTVFAEANSPIATGAAGALPRIVADLERDATEPDYLHVAYRIVANRAAGRELSRGEVNRFWTSMSLAFMKEHPMAAARTFARKFHLAIHNYDVFDLATSRRKAAELEGRGFWVPFGVLIALSGVGLLIRATVAGESTSGRTADLAAPLIFAGASLLTMVLFNVTVRARNALLPSLAILAAIGAVAIERQLRKRDRLALLAIGLAIVIIIALAIPPRTAGEDSYAWNAAEETGLLMHSANAQRRAGNIRVAAQQLALASVLRTAEPSAVPKSLLAEAARAMLRRTPSVERQFDCAIAMQKAEAWPESEEVLQRLAGYRPLRDHRSVSSVSYYRARAALQLAQPRTRVATLLEAAQREAPGQADILALQEALGDEQAGGHLTSFHDPFTAAWARANAARDVGNDVKAQALTNWLRGAMPEWSRPARTAGL